MARKRKIVEIEEVSDDEAEISDLDDEAESDNNEDVDEEEEEEEEVLEPKVLPDRTTRGSRINKVTSQPSVKFVSIRRLLGRRRLSAHVLQMLCSCAQTSDLFI